VAVRAYQWLPVAWGHRQSLEVIRSNLKHSIPYLLGQGQISKLIEKDLLKTLNKVVESLIKGVNHVERIFSFWKCENTSFK
jgi:hypothetical protein